MFFCPWDSPGKNTVVGCCALLQGIFLQGIFPTQGSNLGLLHYRQILYLLSHQGNSPHISNVIGYLSFSVWLASPSLTISNSLHVAANSNQHFKNVSSWLLTSRHHILQTRRWQVDFLRINRKWLSELYVDEDSEAETVTLPFRQVIQVTGITGGVMLQTCQDLLNSKSIKVAIHTHTTLRNIISSSARSTATIIRQHMLFLLLATWVKKWQS